MRPLERKHVCKGQDHLTKRNASSILAIFVIIYPRNSAKRPSASSPEIFSIHPSHNNLSMNPSHKNLSIFGDGLLSQANEPNYITVDGSRKSDIQKFNVFASHDLKRSDIIYNETYHLFAYQGLRPFLWTMWDFNPMPPYVELAIQTMRCHNEPELYVAVLTVKTASIILNRTFPAGFDSLIEVHKADYIRGMLLAEFGGLWVDAEILALGPVFGQFEYLKQFDFFGSDWMSDNDPIAVAICGPQRAGLQFWHDQVKLNTERLLNIEKIRKTRKSSRQDPFGWEEMLRLAVMPLVRKELAAGTLNMYTYSGIEAQGQMGRKLGKGSMGVFLQKRTYACQIHKEIVLTRTPFLTLHNSKVRDNRIREMNLQTFMEEDLIWTLLGNMSLSSCHRVSVYDLCS